MRVITAEGENLGVLPISKALEEATHAAELQLPDAWLPFVLSR